jgi:peptidyl-prolyl isomerase D
MSCRNHRASVASGSSQEKVGCQLWVWCGEKDGCGIPKFGECWGKAGFKAGDATPSLRAAGEGIAWTSGAVFTPAEAASVEQAEADAARKLAERRERPGNPRVFFDVEITPAPTDRRTGAALGGRIEFALYAHESPRAAENFRAMCTGEKGGQYTYKGMRFYRIIDMFIDQGGSNFVNSIWGGAFDDDPGGLELRHDRAGLLSAANSGPDTNSGHFSIVVAPAPHLDKSYTIFGEVTKGWDVMMAINKLDKFDKGRQATVVRAGCLSSCEPRPDVAAKCKTRATTKQMVQQRMMYKCVD